MGAFSFTPCRHADSIYHAGARPSVAVIADGVRLTPSGRVAADLTISEGGAGVKYNVYLKGKVALQFLSADRERAELAARLLRTAGVDAEAKRSGNLWYVMAYTDKLAAGRRELRDAIAGIVREALARGWVDAGKAARWLRKLERGRTARRRISLAASPPVAAMS